MSKSTNDILLIGVLGVGAFWLMSRRAAPVSGGVAARPQASASPAQYAAAIAQGLGALFGGGSASARTPAGTSWGQPGFVGPPTADQQSGTLFGLDQYIRGDAVAVNPPNNADPFGWSQYFG